MAREAKIIKSVVIGEHFLNELSGITQEIIEAEAKRIADACDNVDDPEKRNIIILDYLSFERIVDAMTIAKFDFSSLGMSAAELENRVSQIRQVLVDALTKTGLEFDQDVISRESPYSSRVLYLRSGRLYKKHYQFSRWKNQELAKELIISRHEALTILSERLSKNPCPNIFLPVEAHDEEHGQMLLAEENLRTLSDFQISNSSDAVEALNLFIDYISGLKYLNECEPPLVLGDICLENLGYLEKDGRKTGVLFDFDLLLKAGQTVSDDYSRREDYADPVTKGYINKAEMIFELGTALMKLFEKFEKTLPREKQNKFSLLIWYMTVDSQEMRYGYNRSIEEIKKIILLIQSV